ncbi:MAG: RNHCP domain-containing protein [Candidatus Colwellbacteria bacterium]|jgi:hypothetical protein|nr:RNHCP domain-containing protein [Candidatus Colwellbacteria bacterium]MCK9497327.1 RNHCP domain-containing protein [Candidatus Colwellbacteria bacterium]MDD3752331.1 RNHCP domain-containing protein [Candidatus Colwellbacteria bacterium]MDD4818601.1 RNHCP domain-containing protein [Candidatus Colwellbacteria bacterium]
MNKKEDNKKIKEEKNKGGFICCNCGEWVSISDDIGTAHRNHCPYCLSSKHLDKEFSGDRASECGGCMLPIALTFKKEGKDKYGKERKGELMIVSECLNCGKVSINRIAADDEEKAILSLFNNSLKLGEEKVKNLSSQKIDIIKEGDKKDVFIRLFGKGIKKI